MNTTTLTGTAAIEHAARTGAQLRKHADPVGMIYNLSLWRRRGAECAGDALRADPSAAGRPVTEDEVVAALDYIGLWGDDQVDDELRAAGFEATEERRDAVRAAARTGYVSRMEQRA